jgi:tripartite-type tricarboxylate transporter receptor subunit TctC
MNPRTSPSVSSRTATKYRQRLQKSLAASLALIAGLVFAGAVFCQDYPAKPIRLVVPFAPGGGVDITARLLAQSLSVNLGQQIVIDNRGGAGGIVGMELVARAAPDGYTLLMSHVGFTAMPGLYKKLPFDPVKDFTGVVVAISGVYVLVVNPAVPVKSVQELVAYAKANPSKLGFASAGSGSSIHLAGELFKGMAGVDLLHVPYKGAAPALTDVVAGEVQMMFGTATNALPMVKAGKLRALAVTSAKRSALAPELPTVAESGLPGFEVVGWYGLAAPAKTPHPLVTRINADTNRALQSTDLVERLRVQGLEPVGSTPEEATELIRKDVARWTKVIRDAGIQPQ